MDYPFWLSVAVLVLACALLVEAVTGWRRLARLGDMPDTLPADPPRLSVIVPARNEAAVIEPALRSILSIDYPGLEVVAIDDRSEDGTGEILARLEAQFASLAVVRVRALPARWLGKNHALHLGASRASGAYLLFTDADVHFDPTALRRAVGFCERQGLEHLAVIPDVPARTRFMEMSMLAGLIGIFGYYRPWRARRSGRHGMGVGAFNLVRADAYRAAGGHEAIAMEVLDDMELGRLMGTRRRQDALLGARMVSVEIYRTWREMVGGIQKNVFTFLDYSIVKLLAATVLVFGLSVWPWLGVIVTHGATRWVNVATVLAILALHADIARHFRYRLSSLVYLPLNGALSIGLFWQVALRTLLQGGIVWRGTFYSLAELKRSRRARGR